MDWIFSKYARQLQYPHEEGRLYKAGFRWGDKGTHTSRTIMLDELRLLLSYCAVDAKRNDYLFAIHDQNCLGKRTAATRRLSSQRLSELYALDPEIPLFRVMRRCWYVDRDGQAVLALLLAWHATRCSGSPRHPFCGCTPARNLHGSR